MAFESGLALGSIDLPQESYDSRIISGSYLGVDRLDFLNYSETFSVENLGIRKFIGINVNGLTYTTGTNAFYDESQGKIVLKGVKTLPSDDISLIYNRVMESGGSLMAISVPYVPKSPIKNGDYLLDETSYEEIYDLSEYRPFDIVGISVDTILYCHSNVISFDSSTKRLSFKGFQLANANNITLIMNIER